MFMRKLTSVYIVHVRARDDPSLALGTSGRFTRLREGESMADTSAELLEQGQSDACDTQQLAEKLLEHLRNAASGETVKDFAACVTDAIGVLDLLTMDLKELQAHALQTTQALGRELAKAKRHK
jgi:hypothetical protein